MITSQFAAVIFDFDGTLADTMPLHYEAYRRVFAEMRMELTHDDFYSVIGGTARETIPKFLRGREAPWSVDEIHDRKKKSLLRLLDEVEVQPLPTSHFLRLLHGRVPLAIATSGARVGIERLLDRLGWTHYFAAVVTAEDVRHGKPAPDPYLIAAGKLGVSACDCIVFEDTDDGVSAGRAAGATVIDVRAMAAESATRST